MDVEKRLNITGCKGIKYVIELMKFSQGYEIQFSESGGDTILETDGIYSRKRDALPAFNAFYRQKSKEITEGKW